jgi:type III pantothenate kinase
LTPPERAIGKNTKEAIQSGLFLGYVGLIDFLVKRMKAELGESARVIATGGLAAPFLGLSTEIEEVDPDLTLCGLNMLLSEKDSL